MVKNVVFCLALTNSLLLFICLFIYFAIHCMYHTIFNFVMTNVCRLGLLVSFGGFVVLMFIFLSILASGLHGYYYEFYSRAYSFDKTLL